MDFRKRYVGYLEQLAKIVRKHDELTDTDVRERLRDVINYHFVWGKPMKTFPKRFDMMSKSGDRAVASATRAFVLDASKFAKQQGLEPGKTRHALIEDPTAKSRMGGYDVFLGSSKRVLRASKPQGDRELASTDSDRHAKRHRPKYDPRDIAIKFRGRMIVPVFGVKDGMYSYRAKGVGSIGLAQDYFSAAEMRKEAVVALNEDC